MKKLWLLLFLLPGVAHAQAWSGVLTPSRAIDWTSAGIPGGIPSGSWTQCGATIAAYGSSGSFASPSTLTSALSSCSGTSQYVLLGPGDFWLNGAIYSHGTNHVELRGSGPTQTRLHFSASSTCQNGDGSCLVGFATADGNYAGGPGTVVNWTGGYSQGATSITIADGSNISANQTLLMLDQCDTGLSGAPCAGSATDNGGFFVCQAGWTATGVGCAYGGPANESRANRGQVEIVEAVSCSPACGTAGPTTVTITPALHHPNWSAGQTPQAWFVEPSNYVGVEDLTITAANLGYSQVTTGIGFAGTSYFWVRNVVLDSLPNITIFVAQAANHADFEENYIVNSGQSVVNDDSAINYQGANGLIANNIFQNSTLPIITDGPSNGNVYAYNYFINQNTVGGSLGAAIDGHSNGEDLNLIEGNVGSKVEMDQAHGTELMNTYYRNFFTAWESCGNGNCGSSTQKDSLLYALAPVSNHRYGNYVANVLGTPGVSTLGYTFTDPMWYVSGTTGHIYNVGSGNANTPPGVYFGPIPVDPLVAATIMRWGNWDAYNGSTQWNTDEVPSGISVYPNDVPTGTCTSSAPCPASFFLPQRPPWWPGSIPFPAIGPDVTAGNVGQCTGTLNTPGQYAGVAATTDSQCTGASLSPAWDGHVNAIPAMNCYLNVMGGPPDGTGGTLTFEATNCYASSTSPSDAGIDATSGPGADAMVGDTATDAALPEDGGPGLGNDATVGDAGLADAKDGAVTDGSREGSAAEDASRSAGCGCHVAQRRREDARWAVGIVLAGIGLSVRRRRVRPRHATVRTHG